MSSVDRGATTLLKLDGPVVGCEIAFSFGLATRAGACRLAGTRTLSRAPAGHDQTSGARRLNKRGRAGRF
jgi:hypothetical protein